MGKHFISDRYEKASGINMGASGDRLAGMDDVIMLSIGDPDIVTPEEWVAPAYRDILDGHTKYTDTRGYPELREELCKFYKEEYDVAVSDDEMLVVTGASIALHIILESILNDGEEVVIVEPFFPPYASQIKLSRGVPIYLQTSEEEDWQINFSRLSSLLTDKTKAILINTPNNPTGKALKKDTLEQLADFCIRHDLFVIADDIYTSLCFSEPFFPVMALPGMRERTVTINSFSKNFVMTGFRMANIVGPADLIDVCTKVNENMVFSAPTFSQRAGLHALKNRDGIQDRIMKEFCDRMEYAVKRIGRLKNMSVSSPEGTFYLFPNIKATGLSSEEVADRILEEAHVVTIPGNAFGSSGEGYLRIACTVDIKTLREAFDRIEKMSLFSPED